MKKQVKIELGNLEYELVKNHKDAFVLEEAKERYTDYFIDYDYIFGDYSYEKLRLKGFYDTKNQKKKTINDIQGLDDYIKHYCAYECRYFLLKKVK